VTVFARQIDRSSAWAPELRSRERKNYIAVGSPQDRSPNGDALVGLTQSGGEHDPNASLYYGTVFAYPLPLDD